MAGQPHKGQIGRAITIDRNVFHLCPPTMRRTAMRMPDHPSLWRWYLRCIDSTLFLVEWGAIRALILPRVSLLRRRRADLSTTTPLSKTRSSNSIKSTLVDSRRSIMRLFTYRPAFAETTHGREQHQGRSGGGFSTPLVTSRLFARKAKMAVLATICHHSHVIIGRHSDFA